MATPVQHSGSSTCVRWTSDSTSATPEVLAASTSSTPAATNPSPEAIGSVYAGGRSVASVDASFGSAMASASGSFRQSRWWATYSVLSPSSESRGWQVHLVADIGDGYVESPQGGGLAYVNHGPPLPPNDPDCAAYRAALPAETSSASPASGYCGAYCR